MKKSFSRILVAVLCFSVFACSSPDEFVEQPLLRDSGEVKELWIVEDQSETVSVVDITRWMKGQALHTFSPAFLTGRIPNDIVIFQGKGYIVNSEANSIIIFNLMNPAERKEISVGAGAGPWAVSVVAQGDVVRALVTCPENNSLAVLRVEGINATVERTISLTHTKPEGIASDGTRAWIAMSGWFMPDMYTVAYNPGYVTVLDISAADVTAWQETAHYEVAANPQNVVLDAAAGEVYVLSSGASDWAQDGSGNWVQTPVLEGGLAVFNAASGAKKREKTGLSEWGSALVLNQAAGELYVSAWGSSIACYNSGTLDKNTQRIFPVPASAAISALALNEEDGYLFAADYYGNCVLAFKLANNTLADTLPCGDGPQALAYTKFIAP